MSKRYNARREQAAGRMTHDNLERPIDFGPNRDQQGLAKALADVLRLSTDADGRLFERTKWGKQYRMPRNLAKVIGIEPSGTTDNSPAAYETDLATIHDTLSGLVRYVGASAVPPERIAPHLEWQLQVEDAPVVTLPSPDLQADAAA